MNSKPKRISKRLSGPSLRLSLSWPGITLLAIILIGIGSCTSYRRVYFTGKETFANDQFGKNYEHYNVYVNDGEYTYRVNDPKISPDYISGDLEKISAEEEKTVLADDKLKKNNNHIYDVVVYSNKKLTDSLGRLKTSVFKASSDSVQLNDLKGAEKNYFSLSEKDINQVSVYAVDASSIGMLILYIVGGIILTGLLVWGAAALSGYAGNQSANSSGNSSGNSGNSSGNSGNSSGNSSGGGGGSGSNSNSGGGGGGSGSNSGGSCYVATMVYGSYDAPQVWVLRNFRDDFLDKYYLGKKFIAFYYKHSPKFVAKYNRFQLVHRVVRFFLNGFVWLLSGKYTK